MYIEIEISPSFLFFNEEQKQEYRTLIKEGNQTKALERWDNCIRFEEELKNTGNNLILQSIITMVKKYSIKNVDIVDRTIHIKFVPDDLSCPSCQANILDGVDRCAECGWVPKIEYGKSGQSQSATQKLSEKFINKAGCSDIDMSKSPT